MQDDHSKQENPSSAPNYTTQVPVRPPNPLRGIPGGRNTQPLEVIRGGSNPAKPPTSTSVPDAIFNTLGIAVLETLFPPVEDPYHILNTPIGDPIVIHEPREPITPLEIDPPPNQTPASPIKTEPDPVPNYPRHPVDQAVQDRVNDVMRDPRGNTNGKPSSPQGVADNNQQPTATPLEPLILYPPGQSPINTDIRNRVEQADRNQQLDSIVDQDGNVWSKPKPERPSQIPPNSVPNDNDDWMRPAEKPNSPLDFPEITTPIPGLNLNEPHRHPRISGGRSTWQPRASQEENPEPTPAPTGNSDQAEETPAAEGNSDAPATRQTGIRAQEAKKREVEEEVARLSDADRNIRNLPDGLEERLNEVGYRINRGDNPSISYRGKLPSKSQLHLDANGNIEPGPSATSNRISNQNTMRKNVLEGTGVQKVPEGYQVNHNTPDAVWQKSPLLQRADQLGVGGGVDGQNNLTIMPKNKAAAESTNPDVETLRQEGRLLKNINHNGSHSKWNDHATKAYRDEEERLKFEYDSLENVPPEEIKKSVEKVQNQLRNELREVDQKIEKGEVDNLPNWAQPDKKDPGRQKLSDRPAKPQNILADNPQLAARLGQAVRNKTKAIIAAHTYDLNFSAIPAKVLTGQTPKDLAQFLGISALSSFNGTNTNLMQNKYYKMEHSGSNIVISNLPGGEKLSVIDMDKNTIAMHRPLSPMQIEFLQEKQEQARSALEASAAQRTLAQSRSSQKQMEM